MYQKRKSWHIVRIFIFINALFLGAVLLNLPFSKEQSSMDVSGDVLNLQDKVDELFNPNIHSQAYFIFSDTNKNTLDKDLLIELREKSEKLRNSAFGEEYFLPIYSYPIKGLSYRGFFTIADMINDILVLQGRSLRQASHKDLSNILTSIVKAPQGEYVELLLSSLSKNKAGLWEVPSFAFFVQADNEKLGGGIFRRVIGANDALLQKEEFNFKVQQELTLENKDYELLAIGGSLNVEAEKEGFSIPVLLRNAGLIIALAFLVSVLLRSLKSFIIALGGLSILAVWIMLFPTITLGFIKPSVMTQMILPLAFVSMGLDYFVYIIFKYNNLRKEGKNSKDAFVQANSRLQTAFFLALGTTAIAFGSSYISDVEALKSFALTGVFGAISAYFIMGIVCPHIFYIWDTRKEVTKDSFSINLSFLMNFIISWRKLVSTLFIIATIFFIFGASKIENNINPEDFLSSDSDFVRSLDKREAHWGAIRGEDAYLYISGDLSSQNEKVIQSALEILGSNKYVAHIPNTQYPLLPFGGPFSVQKDNQIHSLMIIEILGSKNLHTVEEARKSILNDLKPLEKYGAEYGLTGSPFTREASLSNVVSSTTKTVIVVTLLIYILLALFYRSLVYPIITLIPMLCVIIWTYGFMGYIGYSLNFITATIAAVSLGVGIDYAIHIVESFRSERKKTSNNTLALRNVAEYTMPASLIATLSSVTGFAVLSTAPMPLFATYGVLGMLMICLSFGMAFVLLPILLIRVKD